MRLVRFSDVGFLGFEPASFEEAVAACGSVCSYVSTSSTLRAQAAAPLKQATSQRAMTYFAAFQTVLISKPRPFEYLLCIAFLSSLVSHQNHICYF